MYYTDVHINKYIYSIISKAVESISFIKYIIT